ncbi:flagellar biosynthetic protein FliO [Halobacillus litoralis]|uniref:flagellar biosynthetic protein FliO n=1 Tax=Halobacillus litoralis TaxID=45668 RepID=UPI001CFE061A|nr:flagellar biosynthetic protein FliO [Halobacillus litoralis]
MPMFSTTRAAAMIVVIGMFIGLMPVQVMAQPNVSECLENPQLEDCPSVDSTGDEQESPVESKGTGAEKKESSLVWNIIKLIIALFFVVALIYGLLKFFNQKNKLFNQNRTMENLGGMNLGPNRSIQAVRIGQQVFLLGVGDTVEMITEITDETTKSSLLKQDREDQFQPAQQMKKWMEQWKKSQSTSSSSTVQFQQLFENQLNDMKNKRKNAVKGKRGDQDHE